MIYLYGITSFHKSPLPSVTGLSGHSLEKFRVDGINAVISRCEAVSDTPDTETLWKHESVIEALMKNQCVLPVRYGVYFDDLKELQHFIHKQKVSLLADLDRLEGCVEISLRVINPTQKKNTTHEQKVPEYKSKEGNGSTYLKNRLAQMNSQHQEQKRIKEWADGVHIRLLENALEGNIQVHAHSLLMTSGAYLVRKNELFAFQQQIGHMREIHKEYKFLCTGPWPPYNFVTPTRFGIAVN